MSESKSPKAYPGNPELTIPSGLFVFDGNDQTLPYSLSFDKEMMENSVKIDYPDYKMIDLVEPHQSMPEHIEALVESAFAEVEHGLIRVAEDRGKTTIEWGFEKINDHTEDEIADFMANELPKNPNAVNARFPDYLKAKILLNKPATLKNVATRRMVRNLVASQYLFGLPSDKDNHDQIIPSRLMNFTNSIPNVAVREPMQSWIDESTEEDKTEIVKTVTKYIRSLDGNYSDEDEDPFFVSTMEIGGYDKILFTGTCTYLGSSGELAVAEKMKKRKPPRLPSHNEPIRVVSDDISTTKNRDMMFLEFPYETSMAVVGAINKAVIEKSKVQAG